MLVGKGVLIDEIKLYGQTEIDEAIDESLTEFSELEAVISKVLLLIWFDTFIVLSLSLSLRKQSSYTVRTFVSTCIYMYVYTFIALNLFSFFIDGSEWKTNWYLVDILIISSQDL